MEGYEASDVLFCKKENSYHIFSQPFILTDNAHGTGCTLSSAIASFLAKGNDMKNAVRLAKEFLYGVLQASRSVELGKGRQGSMYFMHCLNKDH